MVAGLDLVKSESMTVELGKMIEWRTEKMEIFILRFPMEEKIKATTLEAAVRKAENRITNIYHQSTREFEVVEVEE